MCSKTIVDKNWLGHTKRKCSKPDYKDGLCKHHYTRKQQKSIPFSERDNYIEPTMDQLKSGRLLHLKSIGSHGGFRCINNKIVNYNTNKETKIPVDTNLFVIKVI